MKKLLKLFLFVLPVSILLASCANQNQSNIIKTDTPKRAEGQTDVIQLTCAPIDTVRVGFIGLGMRGPGAVHRFTQIPGVQVKDLCVIRRDRVEYTQQNLVKNGFP